MKKMFAICIALLLLVGCGGGSKADSAGPPGAGADMDESWSMDAAGGNDMPLGGWDMEAFPEAPGADASVYQNAGAKLIRRAELSIKTEQFDQSVAALDELVSGCGGYFENASVYGGGRRDAYASRQGDYVVRIPAERFDQFLQSTGDLGYVTSSIESSEDVGAQYYDTEARLRTQRTKQERLLALLEKAESMEDIIALESALSEVEYQIEQYASTLERYDALIGFATISISLSEVGRVTQEVGETASLSQRMAAGFRASVRDLGQGFQDLLVWASYNIFLLAFLATVAVVAVLVGRRELKKLRGQRKKGPDEG